MEALHTSMTSETAVLGERLIQQEADLDWLACRQIFLDSWESELKG
jgi:hypothetical protein